MHAVHAVHAALGPAPDTVALAAALHQPWASIVLSGAATSAQLTSNLRAAELTLTGDATSAQLTSNLRAAELTLTGDDLHRLTALAEPALSYWGTRSSLPWT